MTILAADTGVITEIADDDELHAADPSNYELWGREGLRAVRLALHMAGEPSVSSVLDIPCGHGRVMRHLRTAFPDARLTACDTNRSAVDFCTRVFDAVPFPLSMPVEDVRLTHEYDLIWAGTLITHLPARRWSRFVEELTSHLTIGGVLAFTAQGRAYAEGLRTGAVDAGLGDPAIEHVLGDLEVFGFGFQPYRDAADYGVGVASPTWVLGRLERLEGIRVVCLSEGGAGGLLDTVCCARVG